MNRLPQPFWVGASAIALSLFFSRISPHFLTGENIVTILDQSSINIVVAVGMTLVIASAESICPWGRTWLSAGSLWLP